MLINLKYIHAQTPARGSIGGIVRDKITKSPLQAANVLVVGTSKGSATDSSGYFAIHNMTAGTYNLEISYIGYRPIVRTNIAVNPNRPTLLEIELEEEVMKTGEVVVTPKYFEKPAYAVTSNRSMDHEEIRSDPGSAEDIQRVIQALPGIVSGSDQNNEIIVRGGIPGENLFVMDDIEIPNPNHFFIPGTGGGPINMLNTHIIRDLDFYAGAFPAKYGDKVSSVLDIKLREGNREKRSGNFYLGMAGAGALLEGPVNNGKGSYILSARKSFLDLIISSTGLTAVPQYYNLQGKFSYNISERNSIIFNGVYGKDNITLEDEETKGGYSRGAENVESNGKQYVAGATLRTIWGKNGYSKLTVSHVFGNWNYLVWDEDDYVYVKDDSYESENTIKFDLDYKLPRNIDLSTGINLKSVRFNHDTWYDSDTIFVYNYPANPEEISSILFSYPEWRVKKDITSTKLSSYFHANIPYSRLNLNFGIRYNYFDFTGRDNFSPRIGLSYMLTDKSSLNLAYGSHYQAPDYLNLTANPENKSLNHKNTSSIVAGIEHYFAGDFKGSLEFFYKDYRDVVVPFGWTTPDPFDRYDGKMTNVGRGKAKGVELFLQKKLSGSWHGTLSYSYSNSEAFDIRFNENYNWDYDFRHVFTLIAGHKARMMHSQWYQKLTKRTWFKVIGWMLPFGDEVVTSVRFRYLGGRPYTRPLYHPELREWIVDESLRLNQKRYPHYARLDFRLDRRFYMENWNIVTYFDIMNILGRDNIWEYSYIDDGTIEDILQFEVFPIGGLTIEF
jgi:hypothetical protein